MDSNPIIWIDTMMEYYLSVDVDKLSDEEWAIKYKQLEQIRKKESEQSKSE